VPKLRKQQQAIEAELQSLEMAVVDQTRHLRLVETLAELRTRLRARSNVLEVAERQRIVRLLVQEILVDTDSITIHHSIPMPTSPPDSTDRARPTHEPLKPKTDPCYLLRSNSQRTCPGATWHPDLNQLWFVGRLRACASELAAGRLLGYLVHSLWEEARASMA